MCAHVLVRPCEKAEEVTGDECVSRFVEVRGGYKAMVECTLLRPLFRDLKTLEVCSTLLGLMPVPLFPS